MSDPGLFYTAQVPAGIRIAQAVGITASAFICGQGTSTSFITCSSIMLAPAPLLARQWKKTWSTSKVLNRPGAIACSTISAYLAYREYTSLSPSTMNTSLYAAAALLTAGTIPYTILFMKPVGDKLLEKAESLAGASLEDKAAEAEVSEGENVHALVDKWATLNLVRAAMTGIATICAVWASLSAVEVVGLRGVGLTTGANRLG